MKDYAMIIRAMGEMEIHSFSCAELPKTCPVEALLPEDKDRADMINWLGAQLDGASAAEVIADDTRRAQVEQMAAYLLSQTEHVPDDDDYVLLLILREKWPVGSKAKFKLKAERVSAEFTYHFLVCPPQKGVTPDDDDALQTAETPVACRDAACSEGKPETLRRLIRATAVFAAGCPATLAALLA